MKHFALSLLTLIPQLLYSYDNYPDYAYAYTCDYTDGCYTDGYTDGYTSGYTDGYTDGYTTASVCCCCAVRNQEFTQEELRQIQDATSITQIIVLAPTCTTDNIEHLAETVLTRVRTTVHDSVICQKLIDKISTLIREI